MNLALFTLVALYCSLLVVAPIMSNRIGIIDIGILPSIIVPIGVFFAAIAGALLDVINNNWGLRKARETILASLIVRFCVYIGIIAVITLVPALREPQGFENIIITGVRLLLAAEISSAIGQYFVDAPLFDYMKRRFNYFFARYNVSNLVSGIIQVGSFVWIGFAGTDKAHLIPAMWASGLFVKYMAQIILTPIMSLLVRWTKPKDVRNT